MVIYVLVIMLNCQPYLGCELVTRRQFDTREQCRAELEQQLHDSPGSDMAIHCQSIAVPHE